MFATVMTDISDYYTSSSFVSFYGLIGIGSTSPVVFAPPARMDDDLLASLRCRRKFLSPRCAVMLPDVAFAVVCALVPPRIGAEYSFGEK